MLSIAIQHDPSRADVVAELLAELAVDADVVTDPTPDGVPHPWRTYRHALETTPTWATHRAVLQDDCLPCPALAAVVASAALARPDRLLCLFVGLNARAATLRLRQAASRGASWMELTGLSWCPAVALVWPVTMIGPLLEFVDGKKWPSTFRADDEIIGQFLRNTKQVALATVPCLVDHPDDVPSLLHRQQPRKGSRGAACWIGDCDATGIDWT